LLGLSGLVPGIASAAAADAPEDAGRSLEDLLLRPRPQASLDELSARAQARAQPAADAGYTGESLVWPLGADIPWASDQALTDTDPDFAWRKTWSEAPYWGGRSGYVDGQGVLRVKLHYVPDGSPGAAWVVVAKDVADFQLMDWRIAVRKTDGSLWFASGPLSEPLVKIDDQVAAYQMTLINIGTLSTRGAFRVSEGGRARTVANGVKAFHMQHSGRMGVLGNDGGLWLFEGGRPQGDAFRPVAADVKSFQLEREWVSYIEEGPQSRLMVAKSESLWRELPSFVPVARGVVDFEGELSVETRDGFPSRLHLAAVTQVGTLIYGEAADPAKFVISAVGGSTGSGVREVRWAGNQLAVLDQGKNLSIAAMTGDCQLQKFQNYGHAEGFRLTPERALMLARTRNEVALVGPRMVEEPGQAGAAKTDEEGHPLGKNMRVEGLETNVRNLIHSKTKEKVFVAYFELSSIRPGFQRRAMTAPVVPKGDLALAALSFTD
jgi:hypothetical protein